MSKVLVVLICYWLAFTFAAKLGKKSESESESDESKDEERYSIGENNPDPLKPLVLIVENAYFDLVFNDTPETTQGVPFIRTKMQDTDVHSNQLPFNQHKFYLCPQPGLRNTLGPSNANYNSVRNCLFVTHFDPDEPKKCAEQPKPVNVVRDKDQGTTTRNGRLAVKLCYPVIKTDETTKCYSGGIRKFFTKKFPESQVTFKRNYLNLFHFGYNEAEEITEWTIQAVIPMSTPWSFIKSPDQTPISKSGRDTLENSFDLLIKAYKAQDKAKPYWWAHRLAQPTQYPFNIMVSATWEIVNTAPLLYKLQPLIYLIEERIQRLADKISRPLMVMTRPFYYDMEKYPKKIYMEVDGNEHFLVPNVWSKQIYDQDTQSGIVIIVHNYPEYVPPEGLLCEQKASCQFQKWKRESSQFKDAFDESIFKFAYCCKKAEFSMMADINVKKVIDINFDYKN